MTTPIRKAIQRWPRAARAMKYVTTTAPRINTAWVHTSPTSLPPGSHDDNAIRIGYPGSLLLLMNDFGRPSAMNS